MEITVSPAKSIEGVLQIPGDKSITHRAIMFALISEGKTAISHYSSSADCMSTLNIVKRCGAEVLEKTKERIVIKSNGIFNINEPDNVLNCGNSGTTMRLLSGLFAGVKNKLFVLSGDNSLRMRPMDRVSNPLAEMGARIFLRKNRYAPVAIYGNRLKSVYHKMKIASAQVKSAIIFAGLSADEKTVIIEKGKTRNHTEIMLAEFNGHIDIDKRKITVYPLEHTLKGREISIPGDFSSAAYFIAATLIANRGELLIKDVGINETRSYFLNKLKNAGGTISLENKKTVNGEKIADIYVESSHLSGISVSPEEVPLLIDELPLIAVMGALSKGKTVVRGAKELRVKETDRIKTLCSNFSILHLDCEELEDGFIIPGGQQVYGGVVNSFSDHRIAMAFSVLSTASINGITVKNAECVRISFPEFFEMLRGICNG